MGQRIIITEGERNNILNQYGLLDEQIFGGMIPNPEKTITVDLPIDLVDEIVGYLPQHILKHQLNISGYLPMNREQLFNDIVYEIQGGELMSLGVIIKITLSSVDDDKTQIHIEIRRAHGAFDRAIEVQKATEHLQNILRGLSFGVNPQNMDKIKDTSKWAPPQSILGMGFKNFKEWKAAGEPDVHLMYDNGFRSYKEYVDAGSPKLKTRSEIKREKKDKERAEKEALGIKPSFWEKLFG